MTGRVIIVGCRIIGNEPGRWWWTHDRIPIIVFWFRRPKGADVHQAQPWGRQGLRTNAKAGSEEYVA